MKARGRAGRHLGGSLAVALALIALTTAAPAGAAIQIGETFTPTTGSGFDGTNLQSGSPGNQYTVPTAGVITAWSHQTANATPRVKLKVARPAGGNDFTIVGESSLQFPPPNQLSTFTDIRIPVQAGDVIGFLFRPGAFAARDALPTYTYHGTGEDPPTGTTATFFPNNSIQFDISASLEPDADGDGFGDETQDQCPTDASKQAECVPPNTTITRQPKGRTKKKQATFEFGSNEPGSAFECSLDGAAFSACTSPHTVKVKKGKHSFAVRATDAAGNVDASPATDDWQVKKKKR